ncbi:MAG: hypothetical protein KAH22_02415 [Thiotrichaceae bacterium]|nr:hypothetical protein [Thiotrichaceae bacterium]
MSIFHSVSIALILSFIPLLCVAEKSQLIDYAHDLRCATTKSKAEQVLKSLWEIGIPKYNFPSDELDSSSKKSLAAGSFDILLDTLVNTIKRYPTLRHQVERTFLQWNYCHVYRGGEFYDIEVKEQTLKPYLVTYRSPAGWEGFATLGFLGKPVGYVPDMLKNPVLGDRALAIFFHRLYRKHCFPHPDTGELFYKKNPQFRRHSVSLVAKPETRKSYPYQWPKACYATVIAIKPPKKPKKEVVLGVKGKLGDSGSTGVTTPVLQPKVSIIKKIKKEKINLKNKLIVKSKVQRIKPKPKPKFKPIVKSKVQAVKFKPRVMTVKTNPKKITQIKQPRILVKKRLSPIGLTIADMEQFFKDSPRVLSTLDLSLHDLPIGILTPIKLKPHSKPRRAKLMPTGIIAKNAKVAPSLISIKKTKYRIGGAFYVNHSLQSKATTLGVAANWTPIKESYWFVRSSANYQLGKQDDPFSYSWGIGYSDWHPGKVSYQINNYGPIKLGEGLAWDKATASIGYGVKSKTLSALKLGLSGSLDMPIKGDPSVGAGLQWSPKESWFVRVGVSQGLKGGDPGWSYNFGYNDWRSQTVNMQYNNYGRNELFDTNFIKNGSITINYKWDF